MNDQTVDSPRTDLRQDEREKLGDCRRNAIIVGAGSGGMAYLVARYLLVHTPLGTTFLGRNPGIVYTIVVGYSLYRGILSTGKKCLQSLATLDNSRYGEVARRALQMQEDKKNLSGSEFLDKYPPGDRKRMLDPSHIFNSGPPSSSPIQTPDNPQKDMFYNKVQQPHRPRGPKSYEDLQKENRARSEHTLYPNYEQTTPKRQPNDNKPDMPSDAQNNLPPAPEGQSKVKRNQYGDVVCED